MTTTQPETHRVYPNDWAGRWGTGLYHGESCVPFGTKGRAVDASNDAADKTGVEMEVFYAPDFDDDGGAWCYRPAITEPTADDTCTGSIGVITKPAAAMTAHAALADAGISMHLHEVTAADGSDGYCLHPDPDDMEAREVRGGCVNGRRTRNHLAIDRARAHGRYVHPVIPNVLTWQCIHHAPEDGGT